MALPAIAESPHLQKLNEIQVEGFTIHCICAEGFAAPIQHRRETQKVGRRFPRAVELLAHFSSFKEAMLHSFLKPNKPE